MPFLTLVLPSSSLRGTSGNINTTRVAVFPRLTVASLTLQSQLPPPSFGPNSALGAPSQITLGPHLDRRNPKNQIGARTTAFPMILSHSNADPRKGTAATPPQQALHPVSRVVSRNHRDRATA